MSFNTSAFLARLRTAAPFLSRELLAPNHCARKTSRNSSRIRRWISTTKDASAYHNTSFKKSFMRARRSQSTVVMPGAERSTTALGSAPSLQKASFFPKTSSNIVGYWLLGSAASVFGIVVFGGLTRLTESGYIYPNHLTRNLLANDLSQQTQHH